MTRHKGISSRLVALVAVVAMALAGCGGAGAGPAKSVQSSTNTRPSSTKAAPAKVKKNWEAFFAGSTPANRKIQLLQNGKEFARVIKGQSSSALAKSVTAKVSRVTVSSSDKSALVRYSIYMGGKTALPKQKGTAVLQSGTWKVGDRSFCGLLALEQAKVPACKSLGKSG
ncbi:MAG: hypothetical protein ACRDZX_00165 [Acidimicrobiales bacterium]